MPADDDEIYVFSWPELWQHYNIKVISNLADDHQVWYRYNATIDNISKELSPKPVTRREENVEQVLIWKQDHILAVSYLYTVA